MVNIFKTQRNYGALSLLVFLLFIQVSRFLELFTRGYSFQFFSYHFSLVSFVVNTTVIYVCGLLLNNITNRYQFFESPSNLPAVVFFCLCAFIPSNQNLSSWIIILILSLLILNKLVKAYQKHRPGRNYFDSALLLSISSLILPQNTLYIVAIAFSMFILSMSRVRYLKLILVACVLVAILTMTTLYLVDEPSKLLAWWAYLQNQLTDFREFSFEQIWLPVLLMTTYFLISFIFWQSKKPYLSHYQKPILQLSSLWVIFGIIISLLYQEAQLQSLLMAFGFLAIGISFLLANTKTILANILLLLLTGYAVIYPWIKGLNFNL